MTQEVRRRSRRLDLRQNLFHISSTLSIDLGLQWNFVGADPVDLDASCVAMGKDGECLDVMFYNHLECHSDRGVYMRHSGDNTTGEDMLGGDDETLHFVFANVPDEVSYLMVCVTSYTGADFTLVEAAKCVLRNAVTGATVGEFQLGLVGAHTATLLCCIARTPPSPSDPDTYWDLRELGFPTTGFTYTEVIPLMQDLISTPEHEREAKARMLPDYGLIKDPSRRSRDVLPSIMKFAIGWDGDNDLDCFLVMLNDKDEYIDHVYAKNGKNTSFEGNAVHSGDKLNGFAGDGDDEYIDLDVNLFRKEVHRVFFVVTLYSGFALNLGDVPNCYARMQNKAPKEPFMEIDRSNISKTGGTNETIVFSMLVRKDAARFEYVRLQEGTTGRDYIDVLPWLRFISRFLSEKLHSTVSLTTQQSHHVAAIGSGSLAPQTQQQDLGTSALSGGGGGANGITTANNNEEHLRLQTYWDKEWPKRRKLFAEKMYGLEIRLVKVEHLGPLEPHQFACHVNVWVCDRKCKERGKTSICHDRDCVQWDETNPDGRCLFGVHRYDRLRIMVFEHSIAAWADLDIESISDVFDGKDVAMTLPLEGKEVTGEVSFVCRHVPLNFVPKYREVSFLDRYLCSVM